MPDESAPSDPATKPANAPPSQAVDPPPPASASPDTPPATDQPIAPEASTGDAAGHAEIDELLKQASFEDPSTEPAAAQVAPLPDVNSFDLPNFQQVMQDAQVSSIDLLRDVELNVKIELGRSRMLVEDVLKLGEGSVVELDKLAGDPVDVFVNDRLVARGEVLVLNDNFCVRVNEIVAGVKEEGL